MNVVPYISDIISETTSFMDEYIDNPIEFMYLFYYSLLKNILVYKYLIGIYLLLIVPKYVYICLLHGFEELILYVINIFICFYIIFINYNSLLQYQYLIDIAATDYYENNYRFQLNYSLISTYLNLRLHIKTLAKETTKIHSVSSILHGASWYEREIWDFFGIVFNNNKDLRRLLTDYAFEGYPLKKDFPLSGFVEVRYNEQIKRLGYYSIKSIQEFKIFELVNPWEIVIQFKFNKLFSLYKAKKNILMHSEHINIYLT